MRCATLQVRIASQLVERVGVIYVIQQTQKIGVSHLQLIIEVTIFKTPREFGYEYGGMTMRMGVQRIAMISQAVELPLNNRLNEDAVARPFPPPAK